MNKVIEDCQDSNCSVMLSLKMVKLLALSCAEDTFPVLTIAQSVWLSDLMRGES